MKKYVKGDVTIRDSLKKKVSQRGLGSYRPHGARPGLKQSIVGLTERTEKWGFNAKGRRER